MQQTPSEEERTIAHTISTVPAADPPAATNVPHTRRRGVNYSFDPMFDLAEYPPGHPRYRARRSSYEAPSAPTAPDGYFDIPRDRPVRRTQAYYQELINRRQQVICEAVPQQRYAILRPRVFITPDTPLEVVCFHGCVCGRTFSANPQRIRLIADNERVVAHYQPLGQPLQVVQHQPAFTTRQDDSFVEVPFWNPHQQTRR